MKSNKSIFRQLELHRQISEINQEIFHTRDVIDETRGECPYECEKCEQTETKLINFWWDKINKLKEKREALLVELKALESN